MFWLWLTSGDLWRCFCLLELHHKAFVWGVCLWSTVLWVCFSDDFLPSTFPNCLLEGICYDIDFAGIFRKLPGFANFWWFLLPCRPQGIICSRLLEGQWKLWPEAPHHSRRCHTAGDGNGELKYGPGDELGSTCWTANLLWFYYSMFLGWSTGGLWYFVVLVTF